MRLTEESLRIAAVADALTDVAAELLRDDNPALVWALWVDANLGDLPTAAYALGVEDGTHFMQRTKAAVLAKLRETKL